MDWEVLDRKWSRPDWMLDAWFGIKLKQTAKNLWIGVVSVEVQTLGALSKTEKG